MVVRPEQGRGKDLLTYLGSREQMETLTTAVVGYDIPPYLTMSDFKIWEEVEPPKGVVYNYPIRPWHDAEYYVTGSSGPPDIGVQAWNRGLIPTMVSKLVAGQTIKQAIDWAKDELEGFTAVRISAREQDRLNPSLNTMCRIGSKGST